MPTRRAKDADEGRHAEIARARAASGVDHSSLWVKIGAPVAQLVAPSAVRADDTTTVARVGQGTVAVGVLALGVGAFLWVR